MQAFEHISGAIDTIYKELTRSQRHPLGGQAYLTIEDEEVDELSRMAKTFIIWILELPVLTFIRSRNRFFME